MKHVVVIGAGVGGLTTAAILARAGVEVTVLEAHVYPGGCAGTFYHQGYRFDAGATLAGGFYPGGPMDLVAKAAGIDSWQAEPANPALVVHLPDGQQISRWTDDQRWSEREAAFGSKGLDFWRWQEATADALWALALRNPPWPPQTVADGLSLAQTGLQWLAEAPTARLQPRLLADLFRPVAGHLKGQSEALRLFVDAQLLIAAQTTSRHANALYGASALDLPRRGVVHLTGGMGAIAEKLVEAVRQNGGQVRYKQEVTRIVREKGRLLAVETKRKATYPAELVIANLPPWNLAALLGEAQPAALRHLSAQPQPGWGAFTAYIGVDEASIPVDFPLHHQLIVREPLAEGNTVFLSISPAWDSHRAPAGHRALTLSTHTNLSSWWQLFETDRAAYEKRKTDYLARLLAAAENVLPGLCQAAHLTLPGTPVTFQRFTRRQQGWVGGFPQTNLFQAWGPRIDDKIWLVGDSIFPGQSTAAVALGGLRVARLIMAEQGLKVKPTSPVVCSSSNLDHKASSPTKSQSIYSESS